MHIGGLIFARARIAAGRVHSPSPQISPEAIAGTINSAFLVLSLCNTNTTKLPMHISIAKYAPTRNGTAMTIGKGIHFPIFLGEKSLNMFVPIAKAKNPKQSCKQCLGSAEKP
ncbi:hypothetical protein KIW84_061453 [Lathyrus oleraceus]|uniref:Uncharacterized protein n=1 Tax=Pisum sativum TaxID=3888 RepID=A0A9D5A2D3_PEA|nr:hypothetical protein KIW84_061453 [Pisum sativum]